MIKKSKHKVLIFGYGSVGKKYANYFLKKNFEVIVFDPFVDSNYSKIKIIKNYKQLNKFKNKIDYAVICSLAGDHFLNFKNASNLNIKNILMEKPLTNNFNELNKIKKIIERKKIKFHSNHSWELYELDKFLKNLQNTFKLGSPLIFLSYGGAFCISTGAIHFFNIILNILKMRKKNVTIFSNLYESNINPRSSQYRTFGGIALISDGKKNITFNYSNFSKLRTTQTLIYKFYKIDFFIDGTYHLYRTNKENDYKKITFLENFKIIKKGKIYKKNNITLAADFLLRKKIKVSFKSAYNSLIILLSIILSGRLKKIVKLKDTIKYFKKKNKRFLFT